MSIDTLSNMSYTNKDFNSIYTELLEYASKLSYRWDPSSSDESDPGVVLLKLFSIIGDKDNYNIDKNILELMPASVTQLGAARQIFEQCGYTMPYYRSAEGTLQLTLVTPPSPSAQITTVNGSTCTIDLYTLPQFTMFSDIDNTVVYTSLEPVTFEVCRNSEHINKREKIKPVSVIQGIIKDYTVNNDPVISLTNLDYRNRLYFTETDIAENGIFISNVDKNFEDLRAWQRVDILELVDPGTTCFKLGIDVDSSLCYIEFPDDISTLIGKGLLIKYVRTAGLEGNVAPKYITKLFTDASFEHTSDGQPSADQVSIDNSWITVTNPLPISNGQDPESIEEAYRSYKRVKNTFDTLVSLSDYTNHMITSKHASNGFICDRTNDIQHVYSIVGQHDGANMINKVIAKVWKDATVYVKTPGNGKELKNVEIECDALDAFDLTLYGLEYVDTVNTQEAYLQTFEIIPNYDASHDELPCKYITYLNTDEDSIKCIQHNFAKHDKNKILMIKNKYPINATIIPEYRLTANQLSEVFSNISKNLFLNLNSKRMQFGEGTSFEVIYNAILNSDARIKSLSLEYPTYETYVVYKDDNNNYVDMRVDNDSYGGYELIDKITDIEEDATVVYVKTFKGFESIDVATAKKNPSNSYYTYDSDLAKLWNNFRVEIFAKSVLAGVTPLYLEDTQFSLGINQSDSRIHTQIDKITTNTILKGNYNNNTWSMNRYLTENENIIFTTPNYVTENQYSSYVKMIYDFPSLKDRNLIKDNIYSFGENDFIVFFWKAHADDEDYTYLKYSGKDASKAQALTCSYTIPSTQPAPSYTELFNSRSDATDAEITKLWKSVVDYFRKIIPTTGEEALTSSTTTTQFHNVIMTETELVSKLSSSNNFNTLTGSQTIYTKNPNTINLTDSEKGSDRFCWILNKNNISYETGTAKSVLFDSDSYTTEGGKKVQERTLKSGEYLFYTNASMTSLNCLGQGTLIRREFTGEPKEMSCDVIDYTQLLRYGPDALRDFWVSPASSTLRATEMQIIQLGPGSKILSITSDVGTLDANFQIDNTINNKIYNCSITYTDGKTQTKLPDVPDGWEVYSILNLNMSSNKPQKLLQSDRHQDAYYNQSISYLDSNSIVTISGEHILSDVDLSIVGGIDVDITSKNLDNTINKPSLLSYNIQETTLENSGVTYSSEEFTCNVYIDKEGNYTKDVGTVKLFPGNYLISIQADNKSAINSLELTISEKTVNFSQLIGNNGNYVYKLILTDETDITFNLDCKCNSEVTLVIKQFYKYTTSILDEIVSLKDNAPKETTSGTVDAVAESTTSFEDSVLSMIKTLDLFDEFDYTYHVDDSVLITNPLISNTFLNKSHIYNPFTICQWNIDDVSPRIDILNNVR